MSDRFRAYMARHLGHPQGWFGRLLLRALNHANASMNAQTRYYLDVQPGDHVLEIGFGGGALLAEMLASGRPSTVVGVEQSEVALARARQQFQPALHAGTLQLYAADAAALPLSDDACHRACAVNVLYFWPEPTQVFQELHRVLIPGGRLVLAYNTRGFLEARGLTRHGFYAYEATEVEQLLSEAGFVATTTAQHADAMDSVVCYTTAHA